MLKCDCRPVAPLSPDEEEEETSDLPTLLRKRTARVHRHVCLSLDPPIPSEPGAELQPGFMKETT